MKASINLRIRTAGGKQPYCPVVWVHEYETKVKPLASVISKTQILRYFHTTALTTPAGTESKCDLHISHEIRYSRSVLYRSFTCTVTEV